MVFIGNIPAGADDARAPDLFEVLPGHTTTPPTSTGCTAIYPAGKWRSSGVNYSTDGCSSSSTTSPKPYATTRPRLLRRLLGELPSPKTSRHGTVTVSQDFLGLMKLIHPHRGATVETENLLHFAIGGRKRVKDQILRIDRTMDAVKFGYTDSTGTWHGVTTQEELGFPAPVPPDRKHRRRRACPAETTGTPSRSPWSRNWPRVRSTSPTTRSATRTPNADAVPTGPQVIKIEDPVHPRTPPTPQPARTSGRDHRWQAYRTVRLVMVVTNVDADRPDRQKAQLIGSPRSKMLLPKAASSWKSDQQVTTARSPRHRLAHPARPRLDIFSPSPAPASTTSAFGGR